MKTLYLVDVSTMFFRAFYAIPPMNTRQGMPTNALYGFLAMTIKLLRDFRAEHVAYCFDRKEASFRTQLYNDYKANRTEMPEDLVPQIPYVRKLATLLGVPQFDKEGYEADDVIGSLARYGKEKGFEVVIVSADKDFAQLIGPRISMYDTMREIKYDSDKVVEKWGVKPEQFIDYLAIVGDSSDNVPGIRGVGPKGAQKLLADFSSLDGIYQNLDKISGKSLKEKVTQAKEMAYLSKDLVTIRCELDIVKSPDELKLGQVDRDGLIAILQELEFKSFAAKLVDGKSAIPAASPPVQETAKPVAIKKVKASRGIKLDKELRLSIKEIDELIPPYSDIWAMRSERGTIFASGKTVFQCTEDERSLGPVLEAKLLKWSGYDLKMVWHDLGVKRPSPPVWDQMLAAYVVESGEIDAFADVYEKYCGCKIPELASATDLMRCQLELQRVLEENLKDRSVQNTFSEVELPLVPVLLSMEDRGVLIDPQMLEIQSKGLAKDISRLEKEIYALAGEEFNVASPKQLAQILFVKMKIPSGAKTKTGFSTASDVLEKLESEFPICRKILDFRELSKLKSTYVDALPALIRSETGRVHTNLRQAATATGRLSSINPNLQNIPIRTGRGREIRKAFVAPEGRCLLSADYSQIELRILAHISEDPGLMRAFHEDLDVHAATASEVFGVPIDKVDSEMRRRAKAVNFGIAYGQGAFGLSESLGISRTEAKEIIDRYFIKFKGVADYMRDIVERAKRDGFVETIFGRRRYIPELRSKNGALRAFGERAAINAPMQGAASDIVKMAMAKVDYEYDYEMLLQVHDELVFEILQDEVEQAALDIRSTMENIVPLKVPLRVNVAWGKNWEEAH